MRSVFSHGSACRTGTFAQRSREFFLQIYKITDCCRSEVASDVISGQNVGTIQVNIVTKFEGPSSNRLGAIKFAHGRYDGDDDGDGDDGDDGVRVSCHDPDPTMLARAKKRKKNVFLHLCCHQL